MVTDPQVRLLRLRSARTKRFKRSMPRVAGMSVRTARGRGYLMTEAIDFPFAE
jgi:Flp pilus assembly protein TadB